MNTNIRKVKQGVKPCEIKGLSLVDKDHLEAPDGGVDVCQ